MQGSGSAVVRGDIDALGGSGAWQKVECTEEIEVQRPFKSGGEVLAYVTLSSMLSLDGGPTPWTGNFSSSE